MKNELTAKRLQTALDRLNMKAQELADKSGVSKASISQYLNGVHCPYSLSAGKMALVLGVNPVWLMGFDVPMENTDDEAATSIRSDVIASIDSKQAFGAKMSGKEIRLVKAYRDADTGIQTAVDKLLDIEDKPHLLPIAAHDDGATPEQINEDKELLQ